MARPIKKTVDYFPHQTNHGKTMLILESRWGNDGYAFWFKLLEMLGDREGMFIDCEIASDWHFILAKTKVSSEVASEILDTLASLDAIDANFWSAKVVYCQKFVDGVSDAFKRRTDHLPSISGVSAYINSYKPAFMCAITGKGKERESKGKGEEEAPPPAPAKPRQQNPNINALFFSLVGKQPNGFQLKELSAMAETYTPEQLSYAFAEAGKAGADLRYVAAVLKGKGKVEPHPPKKKTQAEIDEDERYIKALRREGVNV